MKIKIDEVMKVVETMGSANIIGKFNELEQAMAEMARRLIDANRERRSLMAEEDARRNIKK